MTTETWKQELEEDYREGNFPGSREFSKYLENEYNETEAIMTDLGPAR